MYLRLSQVHEIAVDRLVLSKGQPLEIQLHGFCDSSEKAYGACLYLRSVNQQGEVTTKLLCSKSRVAPVKKVTLPRLELCGALLLAQLIQKTIPALNLKIDRILLWTDSMIVLSWLAAKTQFQWHFIPPNSPHFGELWESGVKSLKYHWKRIVGKALLTFEEFSTLLAQVEACLNSCPLIALSNEPTDPSYLSPGHFLIGALLTSLPEADFTNTTMNSLSRWQLVQRFNQQLWKKWSADHLNSLQQHS